MKKTFKIEVACGRDVPSGYWAKATLKSFWRSDEASATVGNCESVDAAISEALANIPIYERDMK